MFLSHPLLLFQRGQALFCALRGAQLLCGLLFLLCALYACSSEKDQAPFQGTGRPVPVRVAKATQKDVPVEIQAIGTVEPVASVVVKAQVGGLITRQFVRDGQEVRAGDVLFQIDPRPFQLEIDQAEAKMDRDQALLREAEKNLERTTRLKATGAIAQDAYDRSQAAVQTLRGAMKMNQAERNRAKLDLEYATVRAPLSGRIGSILVPQGNVVKPNDDRALVTINQMQPIYVSFAVPEKHLAAVRARMQAGPVQAVALAKGQEQGNSGVLAALDNAVDTSTGTLRIKARFENEDQVLWPGQFVRVTLELGQHQGVMVPVRAVQEGLHGPYVYVVKSDGTVEVRDVTAHSISGRGTVLETGVTDGETVVTEGQLRLSPGSVVNIITAPGSSDQTVPGQDGGQ
ncbi:efflux RND transporter periplasmic adaptor subunit [Desulfovibrionales bacterium]